MKIRKKNIQWFFFYININFVCIFYNIFIQTNTLKNNTFVLVFIAIIKQNIKKQWIKFEFFTFLTNTFFNCNFSYSFSYTNVSINKEKSLNIQDIWSHKYKWYDISRVQLTIIVNPYFSDIDCYEIKIGVSCNPLNCCLNKR